MVISSQCTCGSTNIFSNLSSHCVEQLQKTLALDASVLDQAVVCHWNWSAVVVSVVRDGVVLTGSILVLLGAHLEYDSVGALGLAQPPKRLSCR